MKRLLIGFFFSFLVNIIYSQEISLELFTNGLIKPVEITHCGDSRLFVLEQGGLIKIVNQDGSVNDTPFINLSNLISSGSERGLLGLAFHPDYFNNGYFFVNYTNTSGNTVIARYNVSTENPDIADSTSGQIVLNIPQPYSNHNGGCIRFGPDGYLWIATGDGGSGGDPQNFSQNINSLLGKMLRINVDTLPYTIPSDNPYVGVLNAKEEIWSVGLRNPWKFSFDKLSQELLIADVGQNMWEEINRTSSTDDSLNFGWRCYEGSVVYNNSNCPDSSSLTFPVATYNHTSGRCSITGGYVYRGSIYQDLQGLYFFADYCSNHIGVVDQDNNLTFLDNYSGNNFTTFGEDYQGELYVAGISSGKIFKIKGSVLSLNNDVFKSVKIYPNPVNDILNIDGISDVLSLEVFNSVGSLVYKEKLSIMGNKTLNTTTFSKGIYLVKLTSNNNLYKVFKISVE